jgi:peptide/nickel transport system permease protein
MSDPVSFAVGLAAVVAFVVVVVVDVGRVARVVAVAAAACVAVSALAVVVPGDPVAALVGEDAPDDVRAAVARDLGVDNDDGPAVVRALSAGGRVLVGLATNALVSWRTQTPVRALLMARAPHSLGLALVGVVVGVALGVCGGLLAARVRGADVALIVLAALPRFVIGPALVVAFALRLGVAPAGGVDGGVVAWVLPVLTLATPFAALVARHVRAAVDDARAAPFARAARARGVTERALLVRHALPHAALPVVQLAALQAGALVGGALVIEKVFSWPGLGTLLHESIRRADWPVVQGVVVFAALGIAAVNVLADAVAVVVDPRLRRAP